MIQKTTYYEVRRDPGGRWVHLLRNSTPFADVEAAESMASEIAPLLGNLGKSVRLLLDFRHGPPGRNDPAFEQSVERARQRLAERFAEVGVLVATAVGRLQVQRISRTYHRPTEIFVDEAEALKWMERK